jgi:hypothetical protein
VSETTVDQEKHAEDEEDGHCDESECTTFCRDLWSKGLTNIYVNPNVWWTYAYLPSSKSKAKDTIKTNSNGHRKKRSAAGGDANGAGAGGAVSEWYDPLFSRSGGGSGFSDSSVANKQLLSSGVRPSGLGGAGASVVTYRLLLALARVERYPLTMACCR